MNVLPLQGRRGYKNKLQQDKYILLVLLLVKSFHFFLLVKVGKAALVIYRQGSSVFIPVCFRKKL
jgi:hypothetical protein